MIQNGPSCILPAATRATTGQVSGPCSILRTNLYGSLKFTFADLCCQLLSCESSLSKQTNLYLYNPKYRRKHDKKMSTKHFRLWQTSGRLWQCFAASNAILNMSPASVRVDENSRIPVSARPARPRPHSAYPTGSFSRAMFKNVFALYTVRIQSSWVGWV